MSGGIGVVFLWVVLIEFSDHATILPSSPPMSSRIVGGKQVDISEYKYQVSMQYNGEHICGGAILASRFVVTAAHCVYQATPSKVSFRAGSTSRTKGGQVLRAKNFFSHPKFNFGTVDYDVAIVEVRSPFTYSNNVGPIKIADNEPGQGTAVVASGWGTLRQIGQRLPIELRAVEVAIISRSECNRIYQMRQAQITNRMICAGINNQGLLELLTQGRKDTCQGDSGGPLVSKGQLVGLVSWGLGCARFRYPGVYTNLNNREIRNFIKRVAEV